MTSLFSSNSNIFILRPCINKHRHRTEAYKQMMSFNPPHHRNLLLPSAPQLPSNRTCTRSILSTNYILEFVLKRASKCSFKITKTTVLFISIHARPSSLHPWSAHQRSLSTLFVLPTLQPTLSLLSFSLPFFLSLRISH